MAADKRTDTDEFNIMRQSEGEGFVYQNMTLMLLVSALALIVLSWFALSKRDKRTLHERLSAKQENKIHKKGG